MAIKVITPDLVDDERTRARFLSEARAAAAVEHPNVLPIHGAGVVDGQAYLVMRYVPGDDLRTLVRRDGPLGAEPAAEVAVALGDALDAIHRAGYVHRDVKPANVLLDNDGHVYLTDFGLAKQALASAGLTESDRWVGTLDFAAPEQIRGGKVDARADVYALGGVLHFMLTGAVPFDRESDEAKLWAHLASEPPLPSALRPDVPAALDGVVQRALAKRAEERQPSAGDLGRAARAAAGGAAAGPERTVARGRGGARCRIAGARPARRLADRLGAARGRPRSGPAQARCRRGRSGRGRRGGADPADRPAGRRAADRTCVTFADPLGRHRTAGRRDDSQRRLQAARDRDRQRRPLGDQRPACPPRAHRRGRHCDPTGRRRASGAAPSSVTAHGSAVWVVVSRQGRVLELDAESGRVVRRLPVPVTPILAAADSSGLWVVGHSLGEDPDVLFHYDRDGGLLERTELPQDATALTLGGGRGWVAFDGVPRLLGFDARLRVRSQTYLSAPGTQLAYGAGRAWVSVPEDDSVAFYDPRTKLPRTNEVGRRPTGLAVAGGRVFVASYTNHTVVTLDPKTGRPVGEPLTVPPNPWAVAAGEGHVWVSGLGTNTLTRIDY